jgi:hypothetical protein
MSEGSLHVPVMELWCYTSGTVNLTERDFEHLLFCTDCQTLMDQFMDVLDGLPPVTPSQAA